MELHSDIDTSVVVATIGPFTTASSIRIDVNQLPAEGSIYWKYQRSNIFNEINSPGVIRIGPHGHWDDHFSKAVDLIYVPLSGDTGNNGIFDFNWTSITYPADDKKGIWNNSYEFIIDGTQDASLNTPIHLTVNQPVTIQSHTFPSSNVGSVLVRNFQYPSEGTVYWRYLGSEILHEVRPDADFFHITKENRHDKFDIERYEFVYIPPEGDTGFNGTYSYEVDYTTPYVRYLGPRVYKYDFHVDTNALPVTAIQQGINTGTVSDDLFEVKVPITDFVVDGKQGHDTLKADISNLSSWRTDNIETLEFYGAISTPFVFHLGEQGLSRTADVSGTASRVLVDIQSSGSKIFGGTDTYLDARNGHEILTFDMASGSYSGTFNSAQLNNSYVNLRGVLSGSGNDVVFGTDASDRAALGSGENRFDGRGGIDEVVVIGSRDDFSITFSADGFDIARKSDPMGDRTITTNVERIIFVDANYDPIEQLAIYDGSRSDYTIFSSADGKTTVVDSIPDPNRESKDTLENTGHLKFADGTMSLAEALVEPSDADNSTYQVYRFYNRETGSHFFTTSLAERNSVIETLDSLSFEGNSFDSNVTEANGAAVYRFFNLANNVHFYTANEDEAAGLRLNAGFRDEGISYYASKDASNGGTELFRFFNTQNGSHFYTVSATERDNIISTLGHYNYEGTAFYVDFA